jgi:hypothetical protein
VKADFVLLPASLFSSFTLSPVESENQMLIKKIWDPPFLQLYLSSVEKCSGCTIALAGYYLWQFSKAQ